VAGQEVRRIRISGSEEGCGVKPSDLNPKQRAAFDMWRRLGLSEQSALLAMEQDGVIAVSEEERQARVFRSAFGLSVEGARRAVEGRGRGGRNLPPVSGSRSVSEVLEQLSDDDFGRLLVDEQRRRGASGKSKG
jgi:hypothetical protein